MKPAAVMKWEYTVEEAIKEAKTKTGILVPKELVLAVIEVESHGDPKAVSRHGAQGLMQLMPATAKWLGAKDAFDPKQNIFAGTYYLAKLMKMFNSDLTLVSAAYNAGPGSVRRTGGVPQISETMNYVRKIKDALSRYK